MAVLIGPKANAQNAGSEVNTFINFLSNPNTQIPVESNFLISFELPKALTTNVWTDNAIDIGSSPWDTYENNWDVDASLKTLNEELKKQKQGVHGGQVCLFAQGIDVPGESIGQSRLEPLEGASGGLLGGVVSTSRSQYEPLRVGILETNKSFLDFVIRPWVTLVGHYGLITRSKTSTQNVRTDITVVHYDKNNNDAGNSGIRKIFEFNSCAPISLASTDYAYGKAEIRVAPVNFVYNKYRILYTQGQA
jgi:hypothetical protein